MTFSIRDLLWSTATIAMMLAMLVMSRQNASRIDFLNERVADAEKQSTRYRQEAAQVDRDWENYTAEANQFREKQRQEILSLRHLLKESLGDQRTWFEMQVKGNRIIAIGPATSESVNWTAPLCGESVWFHGDFGWTDLIFMASIPIALYFSSLVLW